MHDDPTIRLTPESTPEPQQVAALFNIGLHSGTAAKAPASDDPQELQRHLPQYRVRELIGRGGMGNVMKVDDPKLARTVALKVMKLGPSATEEERGRFVREATVLAKLAHPNIVPIYDLGTDDTGSPFYTMKLVKGRTLQAIIRDIRDGAADAARQHTLGRLLGVFRKVCDAMSFAHSHGIIHRDLKPENIMVGEFGEVLVMDWGLAKFLNGEEDAWSGGKLGQSFVENSRAGIGASTLDATMEGSVMGTPQYMSPEQAEGKVAELDALSDIFSLGAILYAILTLHPPVEGRTVHEVLRKITSGEIAPPSTFGAKGEGSGAPAKDGGVPDARMFRPLPHCPGGRVPSALSAVTMRALSVDKARRYQSVNEFAAEVEAWQSGFATRAENAGAWKQFTLFVKRNKAASIGVAAVLLTGGVLGTKAIVEGRRAEREAVRAKSEAARAERGESLAQSEAARANAALADLKASAPALLQLAESEADSQRFASALGKLDAALALDPALQRVRWQRAWVLLALERWSEAADALRLANEHDSANAKLASILPAVEKVAAAPEAERWKSDAAREVFAHLQTVEATGPTLALSGKLKLAAAERLKLADERLLSSLGKGNYIISVENDGLVALSLKHKPLVSRSLEALRGLPIDSLDAQSTLITDLEPLRGLSLQNLHLLQTKVADLSPLRGMPLRSLNIQQTLVRDLSPLRGMRLSKLNASATQISDLTPLAGMPLTELIVNSTKVSRIEALRGMPLVHVNLSGATVSDFSPLKGSPIQVLELAGAKVSDLSFAEGMPLRSLRLFVAPITDIRALRGMPLENLDLWGTQVSDLTPLQGAPLKDLILTNCKKIKDYTPVLTLPRLERLHCDVLPAELLPLRESTTLKSIGGDAYPGEGSQGTRPVADFWRAYDAHQAAGKK